VGTHLKYRVYLDYVTVVAHPYGYESRLHEMFPGAFCTTPPLVGYFLSGIRTGMTLLPCLR
jgi:hypothetical protein